MVNGVNMQQPQEIEVKYILPAIRRELALSMLNLGLNQNEISKRLGITKAAISQYLSKKRAKEVEFNKLMKNKIKIAANNIIKNGLTIREINNLIFLFRKNKITCKIHRRYDKNLKCSLERLKCKYI